ncbi:hypothetical protein XENOCAPTIV_005113 [Xenoophorus captivus]|uniref:Uncharacterized protein n=1 Tax=Xenoophorus captivus TaxID=1517983 RepID=A0ABV0S5R2_9TELE
MTKSVICEKELLWKSHIGILKEDAKEALSDAKEFEIRMEQDNATQKKVVMKQADLSLRPLEDELQALTDRLEKIQAQLYAVLSGPSVDQTAVAELTSKVEVLL